MAGSRFVTCRVAVDDVLTRARSSDGERWMADGLNRISLMCWLFVVLRRG